MSRQAQVTGGNRAYRNSTAGIYICEELGLGADERGEDYDGGEGR